MLSDHLTDRSPASRGAAWLASALVLAALTAAAWYGWLGWDHEYQTDPVTNVVSGPYETWQVAGLAVTLLGLAIGAVVLVSPLFPLVVMPLAFTVAWSVDAARQDETGLWGAGALFILVGMSLAGVVLAVLANALLGRRPHRVSPH